MEVSKCWKIGELSKILSRFWEIIQPLPHHFSKPDKILLRLWNKKFFYMEIYRNIQTFFFKSASGLQFSGVKKWCSADVFSDTKEKNVGWKICKVKKVFYVKRVEVHKMNEVFWAKLPRKISELFRYFLLGLRLPTRKLKTFKKTLIMSTETSGRI